MMGKMKVLYIDTETTGLNPDQNDIIQVAGIVEIGGEVKEEFNLHCQPFSFENIKEEALQVNGITLKQLKKYQPPGELYGKLVSIWNKYINRYDKTDKFFPAGQNVQFDINFLRSFFLKNNDVNFESWVDYHCIDLLSLTTTLKYVGKLKVENLKLETVAATFGIDFKAHDALDDIRATREIIQKIIEKYFKENRE